MKCLARLKIVPLTLQILPHRVKTEKVHIEISQHILRKIRKTIFKDKKKESFPNILYFPNTTEVYRQTNFIVCK